MSYQTDLSDSNRAFEQVVYPAIRRHIGGGKLISVECILDSNLAMLLDRCAGIDYLQITADGYIRGLSSRIQFGRDYRTFTIRARRSTAHRTEYEKMQYVAAHRGRGFMFSGLTIQSYVSSRGNGHLLSSAMAYTEDIYRFIETHELTVRQAPDGNKFYCLPWRVLQTEGIPIRIVQPQAEVTRYSLAPQITLGVAS